MYSQIYAHLSLNNPWPVQSAVTTPVDESRLVSLCCNAKPVRVGEDMTSVDIARCPLCKENCEFVPDDQIEGFPPTPVVVEATVAGEDIDRMKPDEAERWWSHYINRLERELSDQENSML